MAIYKEIDITQYHNREISNLSSTHKQKVDSIVDKFVDYFKEEELS